MRSLFTSDIPGAVPRNRYYEKQLYLRRHQEEIERFGPKNPQYKRNFQWHIPKQKIPEPIEKNSSIIKPHCRHYRQSSTDIPERLSQSVVMNKIDSIDITGKVTDGISLRNSSSILSNAARKSLADSFSQDLQKNPYFPHQFGSKHEQNPSKLTGKRGWDYENVQKYKLPSANEQYFPKWA